MNDLVTTLHQELRALEADLAADPRYRKLEKIRELLAMYESRSPATPALTSETPSKLERVKIETRAFLERSGGIAHRREMLAHLQQVGIMGSESSPIASFAAYLSTMKEFESAGAGRWKIRSGVSALSPRQRKIVRKHNAGSLNSKIVEFAVRYVRNKGARAQSPEIVSEMRAAGMDIKADAVSSSLSHSVLFDNVRGEGYGLVEWHDSQKT